MPRGKSRQHKDKTDSTTTNLSKIHKTRRPADYWHTFHHLVQKSGTRKSNGWSSVPLFWNGSSGPKTQFLRIKIPKFGNVLHVTSPIPNLSKPNWDCISHCIPNVAGFTSLFSFWTSTKSCMFEGSIMSKPQFWSLPSGKRSHNYGTSPCYQWVNQLFQISMGNFQVR